MGSERRADQPDEQAGPEVHPARSAQAESAPAEGPQQVYSDDEAAVIAERLAALGYIE